VYLLILSRALFGDVEWSKASSREAWGVVGAMAIDAKCGRRQCRRWRNSDEGLEAMVKRSRRLLWSVCGTSDLWNENPAVARRHTDAIVRTKSGAARRRGQSIPRPPADSPSWKMCIG
jgi:hypothetical protein